MTTALPYVLIALGAYALSMIDLHRGRAKPKSDKRRCGFNAGLPGACRHEATMMLPMDLDGRNGRVYLCEYHLGAIIGLMLQEDEEIQR